MTSARRHRLLAIVSGIGLVLTMPSLAQTRDASTGQRIDRSTVRTADVAPNTEREGLEFGPLGGSDFTSIERHMVLQAAPPVAPVREAVTLEDRLEGANFDSGAAMLLPAALAQLDALAARLRGKDKLRFEVVGHTDNQRISAALRMVYPDNQALSEARALAVAQYLARRLALPADAFAASGKGDTQPAAPNDTPQGMAANRRTVIRVWYEQDAASQPPAAAPVEVATLVTKDHCAPDARVSGLPFSISVDGRPLDGDTTQTEGDRQRCVDVALDHADIQIKYDPLNVAPALNIWAVPGVVARGGSLTWRTYANYGWWLKSAEIRIFVRGQRTTEKPYAIIPVAVGGEAVWRAPGDASADLGYLLRVYDAAGRFDETALKPLNLIDRVDLSLEKDRADRDALTGYGQSSLKVKNIPAAGGSVTISGDHIKPGETVAALGIAIPVDARGHFVVRQIMPAGPHQVDVAITDAGGHTATFRRNLSIADKDWFYVALADLTAGSGRTTGPGAIVTGDTSHYAKKTFVDGRAAFYLKGKILGQYLLTASADTREQPLKDLVSNFASKEPSYLLRRIDPNRYYPVYGDDSTTVDDAPSQGKLYVRLERDSSYVMWGDFQTAWTGTELTQYSRGLYGANAVFHSQAATSQGERRTSLNVFAAEPGTLQSREEFRGTGGSLYFLRRKDLTQGSERLWVEVRDKDSGLVLQRTLLAPSQDYDIDYLQGRLTLRRPLATTADGSALVQTASLNGNPVYLVATYEYVPGLTRVHGSTVGLSAKQWINDWLQIGGTYYSQGDGAVDQKLGGVDILLRYAPGTWLSGEAARSNGAGAEELSSITGGFDFTRNTSRATEANAFRVDGGLDISDIVPSLKGRMTAYWQNRDKGYAAPGLITSNGEGLRQAGLAAVAPLGDRAEISLKLDQREAISQSADAEEAALRVKLGAQWGVSAGVRHDDRSTPGVVAAPFVANASPTLTRNGARTDVVVRLDYLPLKPGQSATGDVMLEASGAQEMTARGAPGVVTTDRSGPAGSLLPSALAQAPGAVAQMSDPSLAAGVAAARVAGLIYEPWNAYGFAQQTLSRSGNRPDNDRAGLGASFQVTPRLRLGAEASGGTGGAAGKVSADYSVDDRSSLYLTYARETEVPDQDYAGRQGVLTAGGRMRLTDQLGVFAESRAASGEGPHSLTSGFGVDFAPAKAWSTGLRFDAGRLSDRLAGDLKRYAVSMSLGYKDRDLKAAATIEFRDDRTSSLGTVAGTCASGDLTTATPCQSAAGSDERQTLLLKSSASYQATDAWRLLGNINLSRSTSSEGDFYDGDYTEVVLGGAYRPVTNDRWNMLLKYTYFENLPSSGQVSNLTDRVLEFTQRSHVVNLDMIYDVAPWVSVGVKYGLRIGELRASHTGGDWYASRAQLVVLRGDMHFVREWDGVLEFRGLKVDDGGGLRAGALIALYRHLGDHAKIGLGYNFTDFSDDLTDLSYRSQGVFINAISAF